MKLTLAAVTCSFCPRQLDQAFVTIEGTLLGAHDIDSWRLYFTGTTEPLVLCDRCLAAFTLVTAAVDAALEQLLAHHTGST